MLFSSKNRMSLSSMLTLLLRRHGCFFVLFSSENRMNFSSMLTLLLRPHELFFCDVSSRKPHELFFYVVSFRNDVIIPFILFSSKNSVIYSFKLFFLNYAGFTVNPHSPHILCCMLFSILYCIRKTS